MEFIDGFNLELNDPAAMRELKRLCGRPDGSVRRKMLFFALAAFLASASAVIILLALRGILATCLAMFLLIGACFCSFGSRRLLWRVRRRFMALDAGKFCYRIAPVIDKFRSSESLGEDGDQLNALVFENPEKQKGRELVFVERNFFDTVSLGESVYVVYLPWDELTCALKMSRQS